MMNEHEGHDLRAGAAWSDRERWGFLVCATCRVILDDLPICGEKTQRGAPCVWVCSPFAPDRVEHPHRQARSAQQKTVHTPTPSTAETTWLERIYLDHGERTGGTLTMRRLRRGLALLLKERYGGRAEGELDGTWMWSCHEQDAEKILACLPT